MDDTLKKAINTGIDPLYERYGEFLIIRLTSSLVVSYPGEGVRSTQDIFGPKLSDFYTLSQIMLLQNHTLTHSGTYPSGSIAYTWEYPSPTSVSYAAVISVVTHCLSTLVGRKTCMRDSNR